MELEMKQLIERLEKRLEEPLDPEKVKALINPLVLDAIKGNKAALVTDPEEVHGAPKKSFSKFLGDVKNACAEGSSGIGYAREKGMIPAFSRSGEMRTVLAHESVKNLPEELVKDMYTSSDASGGYIANPEYAREVLDVATPMWSPLVRECRQVPMRSRLMYFPTKTAGLTGYWIPETTDSTTAATQAQGVKQRSNLTLGQMSITAHTFAVLVAVSNQLLDDSDPAVDAYLRGLFQETLDDGLDTAILSGTGAATDPITGLDGKIAAANKLNVGGEFGYSDLLALLFSVYKNHKNPGPVPIIAHAVGEQMIEQYVVDKDGRPLLKTDFAAGGTPVIRGERIIRDGNISVALGGGSDRTRLYAGAFSKEAFLGKRSDMIVRASSERLMEFNQTLFLAEFRVGFNVSSGSFFAYLDGVPTV
jgi:HK97 family phage major capsid protein